MKLHTLAPIRHECRSCGACCNNVRVTFVDRAEQQRIAGFAAQMGLSASVDDTRILHHEGNCPFQEDGWKCRIHADHGLLAKPLMCRVFPQVVRHTESGTRGGVDPCSRAFRTTRDSGLALDWVDLAVPTVEISADQARMEAALIAACSAEGATIGSLLGALMGRPVGEGLPDDFGRRLVSLLAASPLAELIAEAQCGPRNRAALQPVVSWLSRADARALDPWELAADEQAYAVDCLRATLFLRLYLPSFPDVYTAALVTLMGLVICAYPRPSPEDYGAAVASWLRLTRARYFWMRLIPNPQALSQLMSGPADPR